MLDLPNSSIWNFLQCLFGLIFFWRQCVGAFHGEQLYKKTICWMRIPLSVNVSEVFGNNCIQLCKQTRRIHNSSSNNWFSSPRKGVSTFQREEYVFILLFENFASLKTYCTVTHWSDWTHISLKWRKKYPIPIELRQRGGELDMQGGENFNARRYYRRITRN